MFNHQGPSRAARVEMHLALSLSLGFFVAADVDQEIRAALHKVLMAESPFFGFELAELVPEKGRR